MTGGLAIHCIKPLCQPLMYFLVDRESIELPTRRFSVFCSTLWAIYPYLLVEFIGLEPMTYSVSENCSNQTELKLHIILNGTGEGIWTLKTLGLNQICLPISSLLYIMVWIGGIEPPWTCSQNKWTTIIPYPDIITKKKRLSFFLESLFI